MKSVKILTALLSIVLLMTACTNDNGTNGDENETSSVDGLWNIVATVDLGGEFTVTATADISTDGNTFTADITTIEIAGNSEVHNVTISGAVENDDTLVIDNQTFNVIIGNDTNTVVISGTATISDDTISGSGTISETIPNVGTVDGTFTLIGNK